MNDEYYKKAHCRVLAVLFLGFSSGLPFGVVAEFLAA